ncbi:MAG: HAMP domain-containing histidine kinase, partial [Flavobacteriaceae bacterium]|nr:HAMP domain-containing histidine kinase [Flavobacteriaceae bacterium]
ISIIQFYWLKKGIDLNAMNFNDKVTLALNRVKQNLEDDANEFENFRKSQNKSENSLFKVDSDPLDKILTPSLDDYRLKQYQAQVANTAWLIKPEIALNTISAPDLSRYLRIELQNQGVDLNYDFGVYSNEIQDYTITNGNYNVNIDVSNNMSDGGVAQNLTTSMYQINLFDSEGREAVGSLRIFFPRKTSFLISSVLPALISSILLTGLILFCFVYTINVILTQKKVSLMKTDFINNMTHEFKTPIATISLAADSINNPMVKSKPIMIERYADIIKQENRRMLNQVEKVLQIARLDKKDFELKIVDLNLNDIVQIAIENSRLRISKGGGTITAYLKATQANIRGDENHISNVLHNLLDNAIKYSPDQLEITVETRDVKKGVQIIVSDRGIGMTKDDLKRIFEKFYRVSTGNLHDVKGFGLGLSYVKVITDAHNGQVSVESELGKGSSFTLFFPHDPKKVK